MKNQIFAQTLMAAAIGSVPAMSVQAAATLEEVVVTAQKRSESVQDVSIAISAFGETQLKELGVNSLDELTSFVSGAELFDDRGAGQPTWVIRGVGLADFNSNNTPTAAIYYDEYYLTSNILGGIGLFDVARVEILKGPQGGLYGRNTSGGAVRVESTRPTVGDAASGYISGDYGRWNRTGVEGAVSLPIGDSAALRVAGSTIQGGGWQDSLATENDDDHGDRDFTAARAIFVYEPSDRFDVFLKAEAGSDGSETTLGYARAVYDPLTGGFCDSAIAGRHDEKSCVTLSNITNALALSPGDLGTLPGEQRLDGTRILSKPINELDNSWHGVNLQLTGDFDFARLTSISGYLDYENNQVFDYDAQPLTLFEEDSHTELTSFSQEVRLTSNSDSALTWLAGAMYAEDDIDDDRLGFLSENILVFPFDITRGFEQETRSWAVYAQLDYQLSGELKVHGSLRHTDEQKDFLNAFTKTLPDMTPVLDLAKVSVDLEEDWSGHVGLDWTPTDDMLVYGRITQGFKSGGFFGGFALGEDELQPFKEELVRSYELGVKSIWLDNTLRLNGAIYFYDYQDAQGFTSSFSETSGTVLTKLGNIGDAEHFGAELDAQWIPIEGLELGGSIAWMDAEIVDSDNISLDENAQPFSTEGLKRPFSPAWSATLNARYEWSISSAFLAAAQLNYSWRDDLADEETEASLINLAAFGHEGYQLLSGRLSLSPNDENWSVALTGKNLTGERYWARATGDNLGSYTSLPGQPRSWAIEASYRW